MAEKPRIKINYQGVKALLHGDETRKMLEEYGQIMARNSGEGYNVRIHDSGQRLIANVYYEGTEQDVTNRIREKELLKGMDQQ